MRLSQELIVFEGLRPGPRRGDCRRRAGTPISPGQPERSSRAFRSLSFTSYTSFRSRFPPLRPQKKLAKSGLINLAKLRISLPDPPLFSPPPSRWPQVSRAFPSATASRPDRLIGVFRGSPRLLPAPTGYPWGYCRVPRHVSSNLFENICYFNIFQTIKVRISCTSFETSIKLLNQ